MLHVQVELTGLARAMAGKKVVELDLEEGTTYQEVIRILGERFPVLVGLLIDKDGETFLSGNMFIINGDLSTPAFVMHEVPLDGSYLIIMSLVTGG